jgi:hypothetical protein
MVKVPSGVVVHLTYFKCLSNYLRFFSSDFVGQFFLGCFMTVTVCHEKDFLAEESQKGQT